MKFSVSISFFLLAGLLADAIALAQVELVSSDYFPAEMEFSELHAAKSGETFSDPARLASVDGGSLMQDAGFEKYARRIYSAGKSGSLSIEVATLKDSRAAYSLLTLLRTSDILSGPPGDVFTSSADGILFAQENQWVRVQSRGAPEGLAKRVALSVSNRIGGRGKKPPLLISHLPKLGYDASSLRYFVGPKSFELYSSAATGKHIILNPDMEIAQARYVMESQRGVLTLISFPTSQAAEEYFAGLAAPESAKGDANRSYTKKVGPLLGILEGAFDPGTADKILEPLKYSYSIRWIYEKPKPTTIWGVPVGILGTVVRSIVFVTLLCGISIVAGSLLAVFRFLLRGYAPGNILDRPERTEITHLKMR